jgi:uncharacterized protein (TIGR03437 family)
MIAAGATNTGPGATITGVAPKAFLGNYKVFGSPGVNDGTVRQAVVEALEDAFSDGMDVVTLSLGVRPVFAWDDTGLACSDDPQAICDVTAQSVENAVRNGMTVVASAGNDGDLGQVVDPGTGERRFPTLNSLHSPGIAPGAISVGATTNAHIWHSSVRVTGDGVPSNLQRIRADFGDGPKPGAPMEPLPLKDVTRLGNDGLACSQLPGGSLANSIALVRRGTCSFAEKVNNVQQAGARGVIIYLAEQGQDTLFPPLGLTTTGIPAVMIGNSDGTALRTFLESNPDRPVTLDPTLQAEAAAEDLVALFSSHGPAIGDFALKPELVAVGTDMYTATQNYDPNSGMYDASRYTEVDGTSFAVPMVAGAAALVKQKNPTFTPADIKSALVNTATGQNLNEDTIPLKPADITAVGGGKLDAANALATNVTVSPATLSFGAIAPGATPISRTVNIQNGSGRQLTAVEETDDPRIDLSSVSSDLTLTLNSRPDQAGIYQGVVIIRGGAVDVRLPYVYYVGDGVPYNVFPVLGDDFVGYVGEPLADLIGFKLVDRYGVPIDTSNEPASITWRPITEGGRVDEHDAGTDIYGIAAARVTLGQQLGDQSFEAMVQHAGQSVTATFVGRARLRPAINTGGVVDAASNQLSQRGVVPGSYVSIYGQGLSEATRHFSTQYLPVSLAGVSVSFDVESRGISVPGRLTLASPNQINVQVPWELQGNNQAVMKISSSEVHPLATTSRDLFNVSLAEVVPAIFEWPGGFAAAQHAENYQDVTPSNPARRGEWIVVYCNALGPVENQPPTGEPTPLTPLAPTRIRPSVRIGNVDLPPDHIDFAGLTPSNIALYQVNVRIHEQVPSGNQPISITSNGVASKTVTLPIQ